MPLFRPLLQDSARPADVARLCGAARARADRRQQDRHAHGARLGVDRRAARKGGREEAHRRALKARRPHARQRGRRCQAAAARRCIQVRFVSQL